MMMSEIVLERIANCLEYICEIINVYCLDYTTAPTIYRFKYEDYKRELEHIYLKVRDD